MAGLGEEGERVLEARMAAAASDRVEDDVEAPDGGRGGGARCYSAATGWELAGWRVRRGERAAWAAFQHPSPTAMPAMTSTM